MINLGADCLPFFHWEQDREGILARLGFLAASLPPFVARQSAKMYLLWFAPCRWLFSVCCAGVVNDASTSQPARNTNNIQRGGICACSSRLKSLPLEASGLAPSRTHTPMEPMLPSAIPGIAMFLLSLFFHFQSRHAAPVASLTPPAPVASVVHV